MKKFIKNNVKVIVAIIVTAVLCVSGTVYATTKYLSSDVTYKDTTVENALNDLYEKSIKNITFYGRVAGAISETGASVSTSLTKNIEKGKYLIVYSRGNRNEKAAGDIHSVENVDDQFGSLSGCDEKTILSYSRYGAGKDTKLYANITTKVYLCSVQKETNVTYTTETTTDDINHQMMFYKLN